MKKSIKKYNKITAIIKVMAFLLILFLCFEVVYNITKRKYSYTKMVDFLNQEENFDVLFLGSSHIQNTIFPMELWKKYGIVSYNLGNGSATTTISYYNMLLALEHTKPKLIVIDAFFCDVTRMVLKNKEEQLHNVFDAYPISYTKFLAIKNLLGKENLLNNIFEYLFNFSLYHTRWNELIEEDFKYPVSYTKGSDQLVNVAVPNEIIDFNSEEYIYAEEESVNMKYLRKIIEYCKQNSIEVLVTYFPYPANNKQIAVSKHVQDICDNYEVNYLNFLNMDVVDYNIDCYDEDSHLNWSGARKVNDYIGQYIIDNYNIKDQRESEIYSFWNGDYDEYIDYKIKILRDNEDNLNNYLMLLYGEKDIKYEIVLSSKSKIEEGSIIYNLLANIENNYKIDDSVFEQNKDKYIKITTWDNRDSSLINTVWW